MSIADLPVFQAMGFAERPAMLLGADLLREWRGFLSYSQRRVHLCGDAAAYPGSRIPPRSGAALM
jgi:hypothetical protein